MTKGSENGVLIEQSEDLSLMFWITWFRTPWEGSITSFQDCNQINILTETSMLLEGIRTCHLVTGTEHQVSLSCWVYVWQRIWSESFGSQIWSSSTIPFSLWYTWPWESTSSVCLVVCWGYNFEKPTANFSTHLPNSGYLLSTWTRLEDEDWNGKSSIRVQPDNLESGYIQETNSSWAQSWQC